MTRKDYLDGKVSHAEYYSSVAKAAGISYTNSPDLSRIKQALRDGDEHLNSIRLSWWDSYAIRTQRVVETALSAHGDSWSLARGVCTHKQAAMNAAFAEMAMEDNAK